MYSYVCGQCNTDIESQEFAKIGQAHPSRSCPLCGGILWRAASMPAFKRPMQEHWNAAVNKPIRSDAQFRSELSRASDEQSERTGTDHKFVPIDMGDKAACGATDEGLDETRKRRHDSGEDRSTRRIIV